MITLQYNVCKCLRTDLLVMFPEPQQQLVVETLEVLPQQRAQLDLCLTLGVQNNNNNNDNEKARPLFCYFIIMYKQEHRGAEARHLQVVEGPLQLLFGAGADQVAEDVLEVVDQYLSPASLQLIGQSADEGGASGAGFGCQVGEKHLEGLLQTQQIYTHIYTNKYTYIHASMYIYAKIIHLRP